MGLIINACLLERTETVVCVWNWSETNLNALQVGRTWVWLETESNPLRALRICRARLSVMRGTLERTPKPGKELIQVCCYLLSVFFRTRKEFGKLMKLGIPSFLRSMTLPFVEQPTRRYLLCLTVLRLARITQCKDKIIEKSHNWSGKAVIQIIMNSHPHLIALNNFLLHLWKKILILIQQRNAKFGPFRKTELKGVYTLLVPDT